MFNPEIVVVEANADSVVLGAKCLFCGTMHKHEFKATPLFYAGLKRFQKGERVQNAFPFMSADEREFFVTGNCPKIWG